MPLTNPLCMDRTITKATVGRTALRNNDLSNECMGSSSGKAYVFPWGLLGRNLELKGSNVPTNGIPETGGEERSNSTSSK